MILVRMGQHDRQQIVTALLDECRIRQHDIDPRQPVIGKADTKIDDQPFALAAIQVEIHPDLAASAQRQEQKIVVQFVDGRAHQIVGAHGISI